nr:immunoglobulin light chain junction region [Macaca mulatta]MOW61188.1 immunoglobulin light chain junction region [Macaca mulatta]
DYYCSSYASSTTFVLF